MYPRIRYYACFAIAVTIASCGFGGCRQPPATRCPPPPFTDVSAVTNDSTKIFIDGSLSMQGFARQKEGTSFEKLINAVDEASLMTGDREQVSYSKFGASSVEIDRQGFLRSLDPSFYLDQSTSGNTRIDEVLDRSVGSGLIIVISDLFQDDNDILGMVGKINDRVESVGLFAVKSDFEGRVYDVGRTRRRFSYSGQRPVYALVIGQSARVSSALKELNDRVIDEPVEVLQFTRFPIVSLEATVAVASRSDRAYFNPSSPLLDCYASTVPPTASIWVSMGGGRSLFDRSVGVELSMSALTTSEFVPPFSADVYKIEGTSLQFLSDSLAIELEAPSVELAMKQAGANEVQVDLAIPASELRQRGVYSLSMNISERGRSFKAPPWVQEWTMDTEVASVAELQSQGDRTANLSRLVRLLSERVRSSSVGRLVVYVDQRIK